MPSPSHDSYIDRIGWFLVSALMAGDEVTAQMLERRIRALPQADIEWFQSRIPYYGKCLERVRREAIMKKAMFG